MKGTLSLRNICENFSKYIFYYIIHVVQYITFIIFFQVVG